MGGLGLTAGILLAAGAGTRLGRPKGLMRDADGVPWVELAVRALLDGGCAPVLVVVGAAAEEVAALVPAPGSAVRADDWAEGMSASMRAGLDAAHRTGADAVVLTLVDTPGVTAAAVARLVALTVPAALARAAYDGVPGHPVLIGRERWDDVRATLTGDAGARSYLRTHPHTLVECADVADGTDIDVLP